jgi:hypothetical protein
MILRVQLRAGQVLESACYDSFKNLLYLWDKLVLVALNSHILRADAVCPSCCVPPSVCPPRVPLSHFCAVHLLPNLLVVAGPQCAGYLCEATCSAAQSVRSEGISSTGAVLHTGVVMTAYQAEG